MNKLLLLLLLLLTAAPTVFLEFGSAPRASRVFSMSASPLSIAYISSLAPSCARVTQVSEIAAMPQPYIDWSTHTHTHSLSHNYTFTYKIIHTHIHTHFDKYTRTTPELTVLSKSMAAPPSMSTFTLASLSAPTAYVSRVTPSCQWVHHYVSICNRTSAVQ